MNRTVSITWFRGLGVQQIWKNHIEAGYRNNCAIRLVLEFRLLGLTGSVQAARCHNLEMNTTYKGVDSATMRILMSFPWAVIVGTWEQHATKVLEDSSVDSALLALQTNGGEPILHASRSQHVSLFDNIEFVTTRTGIVAQNAVRPHSCVDSTVRDYGP